MSVKRHTLYNIGGAVVPLAVSLLTVPAYLHQVGEARFGILSIVWILLGYFGLFDLGLGMATAQQIATRHKDGRNVQARIFWTALLTNLVLGIIGGLLAWPAAQYYFGHVLKVGPALRTEILQAIPWLILAVPMATVTGVAIGALQGLKRFARLNMISVGGAMMFQLVPLAAAIFWSPALTVVLPISLLTQALTLVVLLLECRRALLRGHPARYDRSELRILFRFGAWVTVSAFFTPFVTMIDRLILGAYVSASAVTIYAVPFNLGQRLCILGNSAGVALFPSFSELGNEEARQLGNDSERVLAAIMLIVIAAAIFLIGPFLSIWISPEFARRSAPVGQFIMLGAWLESVSRVPLYALRGQSRPERIAVIDLMQLVPFWLALFVLITTFGVEGVAAAYAFRSAMNYFLLGHEAGTIRGVRSVIVISLTVLGASLMMARLFEPLSAIWMLALFLAMSVSLICAWLFLPTSFRNRLLSYFPSRSSA